MKKLKPQVKPRKINTDLPKRGQRTNRAKQVNPAIGGVRG